LGYDEKIAIEEAERCLQCKPLCMDGCPVMIDIPKFLKQFVAGDSIIASFV
jgi:glutamate synthase (NADPH/NADH) small chain